jgi:CubicO group peptidase (beta-lactamase class C family)
MLRRRLKAAACTRVPVALALIALAAPAANIAAAPGRAPAQAALEARISRVENDLTPPAPIKGQPGWNILERMKFHNIPGVSVAVFADNKVQWAKGYGVADADTNQPVTADTLFLAGSISKPVAVMGCLRLVQEGKLSLDADVNTLLTSWKVSENAFTRQAPVTLRRIMSHTAGLTVHGFPGYAAGEPVPTTVQVLNGEPPANTPAVVANMVPGSIWRYSGGGLTIMQLAMEDVAKAPFAKVMAEKVLGPLGMSSSSYEQVLTPGRLKLAAAGHNAEAKVIPGKRHVYPEMAAAGLWTTPTDLAKFAIEVGLSARGESNKVLQPDTAKLMVTPQATIGGTMRMALGLFLESRGSEVYFSHGGQDEGFIAMLIADRDGGYGAAVMTNSDGQRANQLIGEILMSIAREYGWKEYAPAPREVISLAPEALKLFAGRYIIDSDSTLLVSVEGGRLNGKATGEAPFELYPVSATEFIRTQDTKTCVFADGKGAPSPSLVVKSGAATLNFKRAPEGFKAPADLFEEGDLARGVEGYRELWKKNPKDPNIAESRLNSLGYSFLRRANSAAALALFKLVVELYPNSWNAYDSLAEGYLVSGEKEQAIKNYEKSLELNPKNIGGAKKLEELKKK